MYKYTKAIARLIALGGVILVCHSMGQLIIPFLLSLIIAYAFHIPAEKIEIYLKVSTTISSLIIVILLTSVCVLFGIYIIPLIKDSAVILLSKLPMALEKFPNFIDSIAVALHMDKLNISNVLERYIIQFGQALPHHIVRFLNTGITLMYIVIYAVMTPILTFYLLRDWHKIELYVSLTLKKFASGTVIQTAEQINRNLGQYIIGQLCVCLTLSCIYIIALCVVGIENFIICGIFSGIMAFAPFFGALISFITTISISADNLINISQFIFIAAIYLIIPFVDANFITPRFIGKRVGIQPFWLLFSICATVSIIGTFGIFVSVPMAIILSTVCKNMIKSL